MRGRYWNFVISLFQNTGTTPVGLDVDLVSQQLGVFAIKDLIDNATTLDKSVAYHQA